MYKSITKYYIVYIVYLNIPLKINIINIIMNIKYSLKNKYLVLI